MEDKSTDLCYYAAADVGGTKIALGIFDGEKKLLAKTKLLSDPSLSAEDFFTGMVSDLKSFMEDRGFPFSGLKGLGVGVPSMVRFSKGEIVLTAMLPNLSGFPAREFLRSLLPGVSVVLDNDSHCAALAEYRQGAGRGFPHMLYCPVSTGLASGIIIDGKLFRGSHGFAGESGHTVISPEQEGIPCGCGNPGCLCSYCSGGMIVRHIRQWIAEGEKTSMTDLAGSPEKIDAKILETAAREGDPMALRALDQMAKYLGAWIFNLYMTFDIDCFVFGGGLINMGALLFDRVRAVFDSYCHTDEPVYFKFAELSQDSGLLGALELLFEE